MLRITTAIIVGFIATSIAIILVPLLLTDQISRSAYFWHRIAWTEFLATLVWAYLGGFFSLVIPKNRSIGGLGAVLPALGIVIFFYAASSFVMMMIASYFPQFGSFNIASQVYRAAGLIVIVVFLFFSWIAGTSDCEPIPAGISTPNELIVLIQQAENELFSLQRLIAASNISAEIDTLMISLKGLREKIQYSIQHVGKVGAINVYIDFSNAVIKLCENCSNLDAHSLDIERIQPIIQQTIVFSNQVQCIALNLRR